MSRTVELGRAVLSAANTSLQLWLTTLITVSTQVESTNIQQLTQTDLLQLLLSGNCWVRRGHGMHLEFNLTIEGEPPTEQQSDHLAESIVTAPVWNQLNLRASLPILDTMEGSGTRPHSHIRIDIDHLRTGEDVPASQLHRIGINVPFADVSAPDGVPVISLVSVQFSMAFLRAKAGSSSKKQKPTPPVVSTPSGNGAGILSECPLYGKKLKDKPDDSSVNIAETICSVKPAHTSVSPKVQVNKNIESALGLSANTRMRHRSKRKRISTASYIRPNEHKIEPQKDLLDIQRLIDSSIRISVCTGTPKLPLGIKLLVGTFSGTLSDICPAVWRLQYLPALSQRAYFLPTISRSLVRAACSNAKSLSLRSKTERLAQRDVRNSIDNNQLEHTDTQDVESVYIQLWLHLQNALPDKPAKSYESFCRFSAPSPAGPFQEDMLDDQAVWDEVEILDPMVGGEPRQLEAKLVEDFIGESLPVDLDLQRDLDLEFCDKEDGSNDLFFAAPDSAETVAQAGFLGQTQLGFEKGKSCTNSSPMLISSLETWNEDPGAPPILQFLETHNSTQHSEDPLLEDMALPVATTTIGDLFFCDLEGMEDGSPHVNFPPFRSEGG